jgi:alpha-L-rhamnosidase
MYFPARVSLRSGWRPKFVVVAAILVGLLGAGLRSNAQALTVETMTVNGRVNPLGIPAGEISFGWSMVSPQRGARQTAYQIRVGSSAGQQDVWDSGIIAAVTQVDIVLPASVPLSAATRYFWQVRVWDEQGQPSAWSAAAWFETGLLTPADWAGADWITRSVASPDLTQWSNYTATVEFTLHHDAFGVFVRSVPDQRHGRESGLQAA